VLAPIYFSEPRWVPDVPEKFDVLYEKFCLHNEKGICFCLHLRLVYPRLRFTHPKVSDNEIGDSFVNESDEGVVEDEDAEDWGRSEEGSEDEDSADDGGADEGSEDEGSEDVDGRMGKGGDVSGSENEGVEAGDAMKIYDNSGRKRGGKQGKAGRGGPGPCRAVPCRLFNVPSLSSPPFTVCRAGYRRCCPTGSSM
jgi:hypothetical protein